MADGSNVGGGVEYGGEPSSPRPVDIYASIGGKKAADPSYGASGTEAITAALAEAYPDQIRHPQATASVKFWNGGPDPLDYISMLYHKGDRARGIDAHWHYVSYGLSDLHGDNRIHELTGPDQQSGFGFELTFRLKSPAGSNPPMWPATLLNSLARYVFKTGNILNCGDHIPWHGPLDGNLSSAIKQILITEDKQLGTLNTPNGFLIFRQVVGVLEAELKAAQRWNGEGITSTMSRMNITGGPLCVTDMKRTQSMFDLQPDTVDLMIHHIEQEGSKLGHVNAVCSWTTHSLIADEDSVTSEYDITPHSVHLKFDPEAAEVLPLMAKGRLLKGRYFVFQNISGQVIVFIPPEFKANMVTVTAEDPLKAQGEALQIFCSNDFTLRFIQELEILQQIDKYREQLPMTFKLYRPNITISVQDRNDMISLEDFV